MLHQYSLKIKFHNQAVVKKTSIFPSASHLFGQRLTVVLNYNHLADMAMPSWDICTKYAINMAEKGRAANCKKKH